MKRPKFKATKVMFATSKRLADQERQRTAGFWPGTFRLHVDPRMLPDRPVVCAPVAGFTVFQVRVLRSLGYR